MKNTVSKFLMVIALMLSVVIYKSQNCPNLGPDQFLPCGQTQATLSANLAGCIPSTVTANLTNTYAVTNIPCVPQTTVGATNVPLSDDSQAGPFNIGFNFCFFGNTYSQFYLGSNGWISFSAGQSVSFVSAPIPNPSANFPKNCIMGPWQDWFPNPANPNINYQVLGTAPCRRLVVSWCQCPMYLCWNNLGTFQIIIYESTNLIENHFVNKPQCPAWGTGVEGLHNLAGTIGICVPGRNSTQWTAANDAWRWSPAGAVVTPTLNWYLVGNPVPIATGPTVVVTPAAPGNSYTCHFDYGPCNAGFGTCAVAGNSPDTVFVKPLTAIIPTITAPTCIGSPTQISCAPSTATNVYIWSGPSIVGPNNTPTITIAAAGSYTCMITSTAAACAGSAVVNISQTPTITIAATSNTMCALNTNNSMNSVSLTASGATTYTWSGAAGLALTYSSQTQPFITFIAAPPALIGSVTVTGTNGTCTNSATYTVVIIPNPTISVTSPSVCQSSTVMVTASNATTYTWSPSATLSSNTGSSVVANTNTTTIYSVTGTSLGCNSSTQQSTVTIVANPTINISPLTNTICFGGNMNLTASGAVNYTWSPSNSLSSPNGAMVNASPATTTNYTVIGEASTCTATAMYQVSVIVLPSIVPSQPSFTLCQYASTLITANGATSYSWSPSAGLNTNLGNQVTAFPNVTTIYNISGSNGECVAFGTVTVNVVPFPNLQISTPNGKICQGQSTTIFASGASTYSWSPSTGLTLSGSGSSAQTSPSANTNYTIYGVNSGYGITCQSGKEILIEVLPTIVPAISGSVTICSGESTKLIADGSNTYSWMPAASLSDPTIFNPIASPKTSTIYTVNISNYGNCMQSITVFVRVNPTPTVNAGEDYAANLDEPMYLSAVGSGTLTWIFGDGILCKDCPNSQILPKTSGCYKVEAINDFGCIAYDEICVEVTTNYNIYIPNIFTPNADGVNDVFMVYGTGLSKFEMVIFDRWGEKLFTSNDQLKGWDGTYEGVLSKTDAYTYQVGYTSLDGKTHTKTGHVTLMK